MKDFGTNAFVPCTCRVSYASTYPTTCGSIMAESLRSCCAYLNDRIEQLTTGAHPQRRDRQQKAIKEMLIRPLDHNYLLPIIFLDRLC